jgi:ribosomal protein L11 methyltransferase
MKTYLEISISASEQQRELLIPTMIELGCEGFQETETELLCYIAKSKWNEEKFIDLKTDLKRLLQTLSSNANIRLREFQEENWNEQWERSIQPIEIGKKLVIKPSWARYNNTDGRIVIQIDPKMSFGTGYHETTRLVLVLLEKYISVRCSLLDVGTGTGVLAIAAIKLGAETAIGIDIDEWSIENAKENVLANHVSEHVSISYTPLETLQYDSFHLITANLTLNTNIEMLTEFRRLLKDNGILLLSGLLNTDREKMVEQLDRYSLKILDELTENEWIAIAAQKQ